MFSFGGTKLLGGFCLGIFLLMFWLVFVWLGFGFFTQISRSVKLILLEKPLSFFYKI